MTDQDLLWYKNAVFYEVSVRAFFDGNADGNGDFAGLIEKLDYLKELGIDCLWLLPTFESPLLDDGYDISDYYKIHSDFGALDDFKRLLNETHARGLMVITDLVVNHTSDQHPWFQAARSDPDSPYRDYYVWSDSPDKYRDARIIFLDTETSNWTWDEVAQKYYWHRFYSSQPDLNYDNPAVQLEIMNVMKFWLDLGVDGFRADAVPYLYEREGTNCENLPETHQYLKVLRRFIEENYPGRILLCEANQWPEDVRPYFGDGDEFHMGFHFPLMPRIYMALRMEDITPLVWILARTPEIPENCQWCTFLRNHDELTLEMVTPEERQWMWQEYAPNLRMRLNLGIRRRLAPLLDNNRAKIELANSLLFTLTGSPIIYYGDEIGMGDNIYLPDRNGVRTPMQWDDSPNAGFSQAPQELLYAPVIDDEVFGYQKINVAAQRSDPDSLFHVIKKMIATRQAHPAFGHGTFAWANTRARVGAGLVEGAGTVASYWRRYEDQQLLIVNNLSSQPQEIHVVLPDGYSGRPVDLLTGESLPPCADGELTLQLGAWEYCWLKL